MVLIYSAEFKNCLYWIKYITPYINYFDFFSYSHHHSADKPSGYKESVVDYMTSMHAPEKGYLPPKPNKLHPPSIKYEDPVSDYLASMHAPEKGYLPPKPSPTPTPHGHSELKF